MQSSGVFRLALMFPFSRAPFVTPSHVYSLRLAGRAYLAWTSASLPCLCTQPRPGKSWLDLDLVTLARGAVGLPVQQPLDCHCPTTEHGHLPCSRLRSILVEAPCRPSRDGRVGAAREDRSSHRPDAPDFYCFCLKYGSFANRHFSDGCWPSVDFQSADCFCLPGFIVIWGDWVS